jgi:signal transduction histidine kinase
VIQKNGLETDPDSVRLLNILGYSVFGVSILLEIVLWFFTDKAFRPSVLVAFCVGAGVVLSVRRGHVRAAAWVLCWGLLIAGCVGVYNFGLRSTGALTIPLAIMTGGWLLGRHQALSLAVVASLVTIWVYGEYLRGVDRPPPSLGHGDAVAFVAIFLLTAVLGDAMVKTLHRQLLAVNRLAQDLQQSNSTLESRVAGRSAELAVMQQQVMDAEKLTSLGAMVAGISHELNTPLGNALIVSTTLEAQVRTFSQHAASGKLTRTAMAEFLSRAEEMARLNTQSVTRAADLVASFKQVAVDQTSEQRRSFLLNQVILDNVAALRPSMDRSPTCIDVQIPEGIACDTYPGPLGQVVTNLVQNAFLHGYEGLAQGMIKVTALIAGDGVILEVHDDGRGMEPHVLAHVFDPFFTTHLGKGGSGLGLAVSLRISRTVLGGDLTVQSEPGKGATFVLTFPMRAAGAL